MKYGFYFLTVELNVGGGQVAYEAATLPTVPFRNDAEAVGLLPSNADLLLIAKGRARGCASERER